MTYHADVAEILGVLFRAKGRSAVASGLRRASGWPSQRFNRALGALHSAQMITTAPNLVTLRPELRALSLDELIHFWITYHAKERTDAENTDETDEGNASTRGFKVQ